MVEIVPAVLFRTVSAAGLCVLLVGWPLLATVIGPVPGNLVLDGSIDEWKGMPPVFGSQDRFSLWLGRSRDGLVVAGAIRDTDFKFAKNASELERRGRVEIWLSVAQPFELPPLLYNDEGCPGESDEAKRTACLEWVKQQTAFREQIPKLFTRMWRIAPGVAEEAYVTPVYDALTDKQSHAMRFLRPFGLPEGKFKTAADGTVSFEILIPWNLFPPADRLSIEQLRFQVDLSNSWGGRPSFSTGSYDNNEPDLPIVGVMPPITSRIGPCGQPLFGYTIGGKQVPAFYFLAPAGLDAGRVFVFDRDEQPYMPDIPAADLVDPITREVMLFSQPLAKDELLCGPFMSYRKRGLIRQLGLWIGPTPGEVSVDPIGVFPVKRLADGTRLIRIGPIRSFYALSNKASPVWSMRIFSLTPSLEARDALSIGAWMYNVTGFEIEMSDDWQRVTGFYQMEGNDGRWTSETFCLEGTTYRSCAKNPNSQPPAKRVLTPEQ